MLNELLRLSNDMYAMKLAQKIENRFTFRYFSVREEFPALREKKASPEMSDYDCFIEIIGEKLSTDAKKILEKAIKRNDRYRALIKSVLSKNAECEEAQNSIQLQAIIIKAIIEFEVNDGSTTDFRMGGMRRLMDDFYLLNEYLSGNTSQRLDEWCKSFGRLFLSKEQDEEVNSITDGEEQLKKLVDVGRPILQPMLSFFVALCHALQEGENELTAIDAYWLGLVDEVVGEDLWTIRLMEEFEPDAENKREESEEATDGPN